MTNPAGFLEIERRERASRPVTERLQDWYEFVEPLAPSAVARQAERCMDCGIPFCHSACPVNNLIPDWNDLVTAEDWRAASERLHATNNFPEFTGRVCPAPCEAACTLNIQDAAVTIKSIECEIVDRAFQEGWVTPRLAPRGTGRRVAVVGSGPAGLACAQQLARAGHSVTLFEKADRIGGLLRYGIPDFKMEKRIIDRRVQQLAAEGVEFKTGVHVGVSLPAQQLLRDFDAVVLTGGSEHPRDLPIPGRELKGVHFAMEFLPQQNRRVAGDAVPEAQSILATGRHVVVIGGGDTGSDCIGTSNRHGAASVTQLEILPKPPEKENKALTWPDWPNKLRTSSSHEEGCERMWSVATKEIVGENGRAKAIRCAKVEWSRDANGAWRMAEVPGSEFELEADLVLLAMGFVSPVGSVLEAFGVARDGRGNAKAGTDAEGGYRTSSDKVFAAGDMRRGQSLVVWAIREGRQAARAVDEFLMGFSDLPR